MSHALNIHDGLGFIAVDPSLGVLLAYGNTVPASASVGYAPGCHFVKTDGTTMANSVYINLGTKASSNFSANLVTTTASQTLSSKIYTGTSLAVTAGITSSGATGAGIGYATGAGGAVTQITNASTGVTLNNLSGQITTVALTTAAAAEEVFTVTNSTVAATDVVVVSTTYAGGGTIMVTTKKTAAGAFDIAIANLHASAALDAVVVINFAVIKAVAA